MISENVWYAGVIENVFECKKKLVMARNGKILSWPKSPDIQEVYPAQILCKIDEPSTYQRKNTKKILKLEDQQYEYINQCFQNNTVYDV